MDVLGSRMTRVSGDGRAGAIGGFSSGARHLAVILVRRGAPDHPGSSLVAVSAMTQYARLPKGGLTWDSTSAYSMAKTKSMELRLALTRTLVGCETMSFASLKRGAPEADFRRSFFTLIVMASGPSRNAPACALNWRRSDWPCKLDHRCRSSRIGREMSPNRSGCRRTTLLSPS
jgi:hypothetical protein